VANATKSGDDQSLLISFDHEGVMIVRTRRQSCASLL
jgi:hypothetical protein